MFIPLLAALAVGAADPPVSAAPAGPEIIVKGTPEVVCTDKKMTGSRISRGRRCRTQEEAAHEAQLARDGVAHLASIERVREAIHCTPSAAGGSPGGGTIIAPSPKIC